MSRLDLSTHYYDGKLTEDKKAILRYIDVAASVPKDMKYEAFTHLRTTLASRPSFDIQARAHFNSMVSDFWRLGRSPGPNYDSTNDLYADDLLYICWQVSEEVDDKDQRFNIIDIINCSLSEISQGGCAQGRTHRLLGIMQALLELV